MKRIAFVSNTAWSLYNFRLGVMIALKESGYEVIAIAPRDRYAERLIQNGIEYYDVFIDRSGKNPIKDMRTTIELYRLFKNLKIDLVFNFTIKPCIYGSLAARIAGTKSISVITGLGYTFTKKGLLQEIVKILYRTALSFSSKVWFLNKEDKEYFEKLKLVDSNKAHILEGSGVNTEKFKPVRNNMNNNNFRFLLIARMLWDKGVGEYVEAARIIKQKYSNVSFLLLGSLDFSNPSAIPIDRIQSWVEDGIVEYLGESDKVQDIIANADCIVLPSYYREGIPRVLLEAASMEKPIIATDNVGCREVVEDGVNGFLCKIKDPKDLADKMEKMINLGEEERLKMGKKGREKMIKEFDESIIIAKFLTTIKELELESS